MEAEVELELPPKGSKVRLRNHLEQVYKQTGVKPLKLREQPDKPDELEYIVDWYLEVKTHEALTYTELASWSAITQVGLLPWEVDVIKTLDRIYWRVMTSG